MKNKKRYVSILLGDGREFIRPINEPSLQKEVDMMAYLKSSDNAGPMKQVPVSFEQQDYENVVSQARNLGLSVSAYIRATILQTVERD